MGLVDDIKMQFRKPNNMALQLIMVNVAIWVFFILLSVFLQLFNVSDHFVNFSDYIGLNSTFPVVLTRPWTVLTYGFFHHDILHILMNMLFLYFFGRLIANTYGGQKVLSLFVMGVVAGGLLYLFAYNYIPFFIQRPTAQLIGASAGVTAIVVAAATFMPNYTFNLVFLGPVKIIYIAVIMVFLSYIGTTGSNAGGDIAHLGGALIGFIYAKAYQKGTDIGKWVIIMLELIKSVFKRKPKIKVSYSNPRRSKTNTAKTVNSTSQAEIDMILDKISQSGYESLTKEEKQKLFSFSQKK